IRNRSPSGACSTFGCTGPILSMFAFGPHHYSLTLPKAHDTNRLRRTVQALSSRARVTRNLSVSKEGSAMSRPIPRYVLTFCFLLVSAAVWAQGANGTITGVVKDGS